MQKPTTHRRWLGAAGAAALTAGLIAASPAEAAPRPTLKTVTKLPFIGHGDENGDGNGGRGTTKLNNAVANACNEGNPVVAPQWYFIGEKTRGSLRVGFDAHYVNDFKGSFPAGAAVVDHWSGRVLTCSTENFPRYSRPVDVVAYLSEVPWDPNPEWDRIDPELHILIDRVPTAAPANDRVENAEPILSLPFHDILDTTLADDDGPHLAPSCQFLLYPVQKSTVWYRYSPSQTGPAPVITARATTNWQGANIQHEADNLASGIVEVLPGGRMRLVENEDPDDCTSTPTLTAGADYLIGVSYRGDSQWETAVATGGPISISVTTR